MVMKGEEFWVVGSHGLGFFFGNSYVFYRMAQGLRYHSKAGCLTHPCATEAAGGAPSLGQMSSNQCLKVSRGKKKGFPELLVNSFRCLTAVGPFVPNVQVKCLVIFPPLRAILERWDEADELNISTRTSPVIFTWIHPLYFMLPKQSDCGITSLIQAIISLSELPNTFHNVSATVFLHFSRIPSFSLSLF